MTTEFRMNREALTVPRERLVAAIQERIRAKRQRLAALDTRYGSDRVKFSSYLEPTTTQPELFGFNCNDLYSDPALALEMELRNRLFWLDNVPDDGIGVFWLDRRANPDHPRLTIESCVGNFFDFTLFDMDVGYSREGKPLFGRHPIADAPDLALLPEAIDFHSSGNMPQYIRFHNEMQELARRWYGEDVRILMRGYEMGPLSMAVQFRGYENLVCDLIDEPQFVRDLLGYFTAQRISWHRQREKAIGEAARGVCCDDWVNIPFISPETFREFVVPVYRNLEKGEGPLVWFHTCGAIEPIANDLLAVFPKLDTLDVSAFNDLEKLDAVVPRDIGFAVCILNSLTLCGTDEAHRAKLAVIAKIHRHRRVDLTIQSLVQVHETLDEDMARFNRFMEKAREALA